MKKGSSPGFGQKRNFSFEKVAPGNLEISNYGDDDDTMVIMMIINIMAVMVMIRLMILILMLPNKTTAVRWCIAKILDMT